MNSLRAVLCSTGSLNHLAVCFNHEAADLIMDLISMIIIG